MKNLIFAVLAFASISTSFAQNALPNQQCIGLNPNDQKVETKLYVGKKINKTESNATLVIRFKGVRRVTGVITNKADLLGTRMFKSSDDSLRFLTTGLLWDTETEGLQLNMDCTQFKM